MSSGAKSNNPQYKRTRFEREADKAIVARMYIQGKTQVEIAQALAEERGYTLTQQMISKDLKDILDDWRRERFDDIDNMKGEEIARINRVEAEAWSAWLRSCERRVEVSASLEDQTDAAAIFAAFDDGTPEDEQDPDGLLIGEDGVLSTSEAGKAKVYKETRKVLIRDGNPAFLELVRHCISDRCKILGIQAPKNITLKTEYIVGLVDDTEEEV